MAAIVLIGGVAWGVTEVKAQSSSSKFPNLVQMIAQKFGLKESDVQAVVDQAHQQRQTQLKDQMNTKINDFLDQAIKDGKLTADQKQYILNKISDYQSSVQNTNPKDRWQKMQTLKTDLTNWAKQNNLDLNYFSSKLKGLWVGKMMGFKGRKMN